MAVDGCGVSVFGLPIAGMARAYARLASASPTGDGRRASDAVAAADWAAGVPDSLFDHRADVEFILDPVTLRKGRAHTVLHLDPNVRGDKAVITF